MQPNGVTVRLEAELRALEAKARKRTLRTANGVDFTSNDYLALTRNEELRRRVVTELRKGDIALGSGGSRLLRGNHRWHEEAESYFSNYQGSEASLFFTSGYAANMAVLTSIPTRHDVIIYDSSVHASIKEGIHAGLATRRAFEHNSMRSLEAALDATDNASENESRILRGSGIEKQIGSERQIGSEKQNVSKTSTFVVVESLYSMDGDEAPLRELALLSRRRGFDLIVDEAHATGLFGVEGKGLIAESGIRDSVFASIHPCGKALAGAGAFVAGSWIVKDFLLNRARTMIFTTALPPIAAYTLVQAMEIIRSEPERRTRALANAAYVRSNLAAKLRRWKVLGGRSPIIPLILGTDRESVEVANELNNRGMDVRPIRPPTVPEGSARFRLTVNSEHTQEELDLLCRTLIELELTMR